VFGAAVLVIRRDRPKSPKAKVTNSSFRWPTRREKDHLE
jgi:hypothetical protein